MAATVEAREASAEQFARIARATAAPSLPESIRKVREAALERFLEQGLPTSRDEDWRFTSIAPLARSVFTEAGAAPGAITLPDVVGEKDLVFVFADGRFVDTRSASSAPEGISVRSLAAVIGDAAESLQPWLGQVAPPERPFVALNTATLRDGAVVRVGRNAPADAVIHLVHVASTPNVYAPLRNVVVLEAGAQATVIETFAGATETATFTNAVTEVFLGPNAVLDHNRVQLESTAAFHVGGVFVRQERDSQYRSRAISFGAAISRTDIDTALAAEGAGCSLDGLYVVRGEQVVDFHTLIDHAMPHCDSKEFYKGILDDHARGVFDGRIMVRKDAQKTNSAQSNRNLVLSRDAIVDSKPQLEIYADDVKCTHGSTIGQLSEESLFYLRARAIGEEEARAILTYAFASEVVERIPQAHLREAIAARLLTLLPRGGAR